MSSWRWDEALCLSMPEEDIQGGQMAFWKPKIVYWVAAASPAPADAALPYFVLLYLGRMRFQRRCEYRSLRS